jgi:antitoxin component YwqK of YwqJK toxin-antitoxin module
MKWTYYIILLLSVACTGNITVSEDDIGADVFYEEGSYKPYTGKCTVLYNRTDIVKEQFTFRNGLLQGEALAWYKNGQLRRKGYYCKGQISGKWIFWDELGHKLIEANYKDDFLDGSYLALYSNGKPKEKGQFSENKRTGKWIYYNEQGKIISSTIR